MTLIASYLRTLLAVKCKACERIDYDVNIEHDFIHEYKNNRYMVFTKMICPECGNTEFEYKRLICNK